MAATPGIDLETFAAISAEIAEGDRPPADVLAARELTAEQWTEVTLFWTGRMAEDARPDASGEVAPRVVLAFSEAFARAQDGQARGETVNLSVTEWAELVHEIEASDGGPSPVLARRGLRLADYSRLVRRWAKAIATTPALAKEYASAREARRQRP